VQGSVRLLHIAPAICYWYCYHLYFNCYTIARVGIRTTRGILYFPNMPLTQNIPYDTWHRLHSKMPLTQNILCKKTLHRLHSKNATNTEHTPYDNWHLLHSKMALTQNILCKKTWPFYIAKMPLTEHIPYDTWHLLHSKMPFKNNIIRNKICFLLHSKHVTNTEQTPNDTQYLLCSKMPETEHTPYNAWHLPQSKHTSNTKHTPVLHTPLSENEVAACLIEHYALKKYTIFDLGTSKWLASRLGRFALRPVGCCVGRSGRCGVLPWPEPRLYEATIPWPLQTDQTWV
jgi:hypothetical protein